MGAVWGEVNMCGGLSTSGPMPFSELRRWLMLSSGLSDVSVIGTSSPARTREGNLLRVVSASSVCSTFWEMRI